MKSLAPKDLEKRIIQFLKKQNMCILATCGDNVAQATPIEYHSKRTTIYFVGEPGAKMENMKKNPNFSIGIFLPYTGWDSAKGAQITGKAKIISRENSTEFSEVLAAYQWEKTAKELGLKTFPENRVEPVKIELRR